ncbi:MAG: 2-hydroxyacid dehydrogenase [Hyphomicrobiaceae bacterium]
MLRVLFQYEAGPNMAAKLDRLKDQNLDIDVVPPQDQARFGSCLQEADVVWHVLQPITEKMIRSASKLRLIQKIGVGVNTIDLETAEACGIAVCNMPGTNSRAVAEMTLTLMLGAMRRITYLDRATHAGNWHVPPDVHETFGEIHGRTVGFFGYGATARILTPILKSMGARLIYTATSPKSGVDAEWRDFSALTREADIISLHAPLTPDTAGVFDATAIRSMKPGVIIVNTARGELIDQAALVQALLDGHVGAAGLDVFASEPIDKSEKILQFENVVVAPHVSWLTSETLDRSLGVAAENCRRLLANETLIHRVR